MVASSGVSDKKQIGFRRAMAVPESSSEYDNFRPMPNPRNFPDGIGAATIL
jgi:hypothetical protein